MTAVPPEEVRRLLVLCRQLRSLRAPDAWRPHLARQLEELIGARAGVIAEADVRGEAPRLTHVVTRGVPDRDRERFLTVTRTIANGAAPLESLRALHVPFTVTRADLVDDERWYGSLLSRELQHATGCDELLLSCAPAPTHEVTSLIVLFRGRGEPRFSARDRLLVQLVHEDLSASWTGGDLVLEGLPRRQRQVLALLAEGGSEKQIAARLQISLHTTHDHVKALYARFRVHSRGELLARISAEHARARLAVEC